MEEACAGGDFELVKESFASMLRSSDNTIPLTDRVMPGAIEVIQRSACLAARHGHTTIFSFLLDQGAPINASVAAAAFTGNNVELCQALLNHGWEPRAGEVHNLSILSSEISLRWMLEHRWNPNLYGHNDIHPLTVAAAYFPPSVVKILLDHGVSTRGTQAMHAAASMAGDDPTRFEVLDLLLQYDGDVDEMEVDPKGRNPPRQRTGFTGTPLHHAICTNSVEAFDYKISSSSKPDYIIKMKSSSVLLVFFVASALGGVLAPAPLPTRVIRDASPACTWVPTTQDPGTCSADVLTMYTTAPPVVTSVPPDPNVACSYHKQDPDEGIDQLHCPGATTSVSADLPPPTTNINACMVCTPYPINGDNCNTIQNCTPQIAVATVTVGSAPVHVGTLTGAVLYTSVSNALESLCPPVTQTTTSTQCSVTGHADIGGIKYVDSSESLDTGSLVVKVPTSGYNVTSLRDAMIASIALFIQTSTTGSNCFNVRYTVEELKRRDGLLGWVDEALRVPRSLLDFGGHEVLNPRDHPHPTKEQMTMCNGAYFHTANYYDPFWRTAPQPGPSDSINALFTFEASNSDQFLCEFLNMMVDGLTLLAPEFAVEDVELEEGINALCCLTDGGCQLES
ncbi:hypothetical protein G7Y89_g13641 [Cudoniella acicularis]|uniref:Uncharacterized protein n=1 Tax=Cudoniella acicularis TaxID=354080 RepID=A0A8H4R6H8_9HELO|nr:hypothetical protein G7Y89_g13641 [Cudoniella acicularis]